MVLWSGLGPDPTSHPSPVCLAAVAGRAGLFSDEKWWTLSRGVEGASIVVMEEGFRAENIHMHNTTHLGIRHHSSELHHAWGC